jgi:membrane-associated phospholipid phosphatase
VLAGASGLYIDRHAGIDGFDRWAYSFVVMRYHSPPLVAIADVGNPAVVAVVGVVAALLVVRRDRRRALACIAGPFLGGVLAEYVLKPLVDPRADGLSFPSGHTVGVAAVVSVLLLVLPRRTRGAVTALGLILGMAACYAVVALGWHSPTDAVAGLAVGGGSVLVVDGVVEVAQRPSEISSR